MRKKSKNHFVLSFPEIPGFGSRPTELYVHLSDEDGAPVEGVIRAWWAGNKLIIPKAELMHWLFGPDKEVSR